MAGNTNSIVLSLHGGSAASVAGAVGGGLKKLVRRMNDAFETQRRREIDREIGRLLAQSGGRLTDSVEREIARALVTSNWRLPY